MLPVVHVLAAGPPLWPDEATAIGTIALAFLTFVAVVVTIAVTRKDRQNAVSDANIERGLADARLDRELAASGAQLQDERAAADQRLQRQLDASAQQLQDERAAADQRLQRQLDASAQQLQDERAVIEKREQLAEAYLVQVTPGRMSVEWYGSLISTEPGTAITCPCVIIVNRGNYTITDICARFSYDGTSVMQYDKQEHFSGLRGLPEELSNYIADEPDIRLTTLTPTDVGLRFSHDAIAKRNLHGAYPIVRWRDRWDQTWEYKLGIVYEVESNQPWTL